MKKALLRRLAAMSLVVLVWGLISPAIAVSAPLKLSFSYPTEGASLTAKQIPVTVTLQAPRGTVGLDFLVNGIVYKSYRVEHKGGAVKVPLTKWETAELPAGRYTLTVIARNKVADASASLRLYLTGDRVPCSPLRIETPEEGAMVAGRIEVRTNVDQADGSNAVLMVDGKLRAITNVPPYSFDLNTDILAKGLHSLQVQVYGANGDIVYSKVTSIQVADPQVVAAARSGQPHVAAQPGKTVQLAKTPAQLSRSGAVAVAPAHGSGSVTAQARQVGMKVSQTPAPNWKLNLTGGPKAQAIARPTAPTPAARPAPSISIVGKEVKLLPGTGQQLANSGYQLRIEGPAVSLSAAPTVKPPVVATRPAPVSRPAASTSAAGRQLAMLPGSGHSVSGNYAPRPAEGAVALSTPIGNPTTSSTVRSQVSPMTSREMAVAGQPRVAGSAVALSTPRANPTISVSGTHVVVSSASGQSGSVTGQPRMAGGTLALTDPVSAPTTSLAPQQVALLPNSMTQSGSAAGHLRLSQGAVSLSAVPTGKSPQVQPAVKPTSAPVRVARVAAKSGIVLHKVSQGDCLWNIARRYGVRMSTIAAANDLSKNQKIRAGAQVWVPTGPTLIVDGKPLATQPGPYFSNGKLMLPLRAIVEACGGSADWNEKSNAIVLNVNGVKLVLRAGSSRALVNDQTVQLSNTLAFRANRAFLPFASLREIAALPTRMEIEKNQVQVARLRR